MGSDIQVKRIGGRVGTRSKQAAAERARQAFEAARKFGKMFERKAVMR